MCIQKGKKKKENFGFQCKLVYKFELVESISGMEMESVFSLKWQKKSDLLQLVGKF